MGTIIICFGTRQDKCTFEEGSCRCLKVNITDRLFKTHVVQESVTKGKILEQINIAEKIIVADKYLTITTPSHCLSVTLEND